MEKKDKILQELDIFLDDIQELLPPKYIFLAGLIVGKSQGLITLQSIFELLINLVKIGNQKHRVTIENLLYEIKNK